MTHLADLVRDRRERLHLSYATLSAASCDPESGTSVSYGWIHRLERGQPVVPPQVPQLRALACGLRLPLSLVQEAAAAQFFGLEPAGHASAEVLAIAGRIADLSADQRDALVGFLDAFKSSV